jgi:hypothetical protein
MRELLVNKDCCMPRRTMPSLPLVILIGAPILSMGCTSVQLRKSTVAQSSTLGDIYTKQVMNNLALFITNPDALPFFAYPNQGTAAIQDQGSLIGPGNTYPNYVTTPLSLSASRQATENWVLVPIADPAKLALMRCAYRQALSACIPMVPAALSVCPNCTELRRDFYGPSNPAIPDQSHEDVPCLDSACWLAWGCKHKVPKHCDAPYVGCYRGLYVWVPPAGRDMLTRLTLTILDYAVNDPKQFDKRTKTVQLNVNEDGSINYEGKGPQITATLPVDVPSDWIAALDRTPAYSEFLATFGSGAARRLLAIAEASQQYVHKSIEDKKAFWKGVSLQIDPDGHAWPEDLKPALEFIRNNKILPWLVPTEEVLHGPAVYTRRGNASDGLQAIGQRLNAALAPSSATGR